MFYQRPLLTVVLGGLLLNSVTVGTAESAPTAVNEAAEIRPSAMFEAVDQIFADFALDAHTPGLVYGVVADGRLVHVRGFGVQDLESKRPVTPDTLFRIASMTKAFTALTVLKLRDEGKLRLDAPAETYVPELRDWTYPTTDSPRIRVRNLLNHTAGFVTDDPWGDRQTPLPESEFSQLLRNGMAFNRPPATAMEYSNLGFALLGRIITNVSGRPYAETITSVLLKPLGMESSGFVVDAAPRERRALGYRWENDAWRLEPTLAHGAFGAMGGLQTSANDYAKWVAFLLSAWPPRDDRDSGPVARATVRELAQGSNFPQLLPPRAGNTGPGACTRAGNYAMGLFVLVDCDLGTYLSHPGGYPGYGSFVVLLPDYGVGIFAFANRTYAGPTQPVYDAVTSLKNAGFLKDRTIAVTDDLAKAYRVTATVYREGTVAAGGDIFAMNFLMDRDVQGWSKHLESLKKQVGDCETSAPVTPTGALSGEFVWRCAHGRLTGSVLLTPTQPPRIQALELAPKASSD
jgi:D-alanyl-D-alanine-carboxypeptidase/D-alanyl-D-alanine-endopeptidase